MEILFSAIIGDLVNRSASFVISKCFQQQPDIDKILQRLERVVLRIDTIVEEAEGRHIANQGMLRQLKLLRQGMYRGHYILDALKFRAIGEEEENKEGALSKFSPAKRLRFSCSTATASGSIYNNMEAQLFGTNNIQEELQRVVDNLEDTIAGMKEFLFLLNLYPRIVRQPYGAYLLLDNCMFGRQMERHRVLNFLLRSGPSPDLAVLPMVGPIRAGKTTLVENVCKDECVRDRFSMVLFFPEGYLRDEGVLDLKENSINDLVKHQNCSSSQHSLLVIVEIAEDINQDTWRRLKSSIARMTPCGGSKIIITSRSDRIVSLGTTEALRLDYLPQEAYWYFFKTLVFGSTNPDEEPKLATMAMEIALEQRQCFTSAHILAGILRDNFNARFWRTVLHCVRAYIKTHLLMFDQHPNLRLREDEPIYYWRMEKSRGYFLISKYHQSDSSAQVPRIRMRDILLECGGTLPRGEFEAVAWTSRIPPYYNYTISCKMQAPQVAVGRRKRVHQDEQHLI
ncbi:uncharacterized protein LOC119299259 [Triticum dicoccoides]|uniref:uncharacterized protein LOC119299259 n=1 Tax=Triticum dicoccoides TaxID=85692 RepID=UPI00188F7083|nr:uncharacterized protein LOC119299259 [Triticum dicoccoides]